MKASELKDRPASEHTLPVRQRILADCERLDWRAPALETGVPGLTLYRVTEPSAPFSSIYEPVSYTHLTLPTIYSV